MSELDRRALLGAMGLTGVAAVAARGQGGPLAPPAGPVSPSGRTLDDVYNAALAAGNRPGYNNLPGDTLALPMPFSRYSATEDRAGNDTLLFTNASYIVIDLNDRVWSTSNALQPLISVNNNVSGIVIRNGTLIGGNSGIFIGGAVDGVLIQNVTFVGQRTGAVVAGNAGARRITVENCEVHKVGAGTLPTDAVMSMTGVLLAGSHHSVRNCRIRGFAYNGGGTPTFRGVWFNTAAGVGNEVNGCTVSGENIPVGGGNAGIQFAGSGAYRNNTVMGFTITPYSVNAGVLNGGGNV